MILRAKYVAPICRPTLENGFVEVQEGRIVEVGMYRGTAGANVIDLGQAVLIPGLVNAHTHLELSHLHNQFSPRLGFMPWIEKVGIQVLADDQKPETFAESARQGALQSVGCGVTLACDITRRPDVTRPILAGAELRIVSCGEIIATGKIRHLAAKRIVAACDPATISPTLSVGISPHSPYLCEPAVWPACMEASRRDSLTLCVHAAETRDELQYLKTNDGPIRDFLTRLGICDEAIECLFCSPIEFLKCVGGLGPKTLLAHVNYVSDSDIQLIASSGTAVVYCPRTHDAFGHEPHPLPRLLQAGVEVCLGTDSLASNPSLSILDEARWVHKVLPQLACTRILGMITHIPGRRLGPCDGYATLSPGSPADFTAVPLDHTGPSDPLENILSSKAQPKSTWLGGALVHHDEEQT